MSEQHVGRPPFLPTEEAPVRDCTGDVLGVKAAAQVVGISRTALWRLASTGKIACTKVGSTKGKPQFLFEREVLVQFRLKRTLARSKPKRLRNGRLQMSLHEAVSLMEQGADIELDQLPRRLRL